MVNVSNDLLYLGLFIGARETTKYLVICNTLLQVRMALTATLSSSIHCVVQKLNEAKLKYLYEHNDHFELENPERTATSL